MCPWQRGADERECKNIHFSSSPKQATTWPAVLSGTVSFNDSKAEWTRPYSVELPPNNRDAILAKRPYRRTRYFGRNELSGLVMGALRLATRPLTSAEIATTVLQAKEMPTGHMAFKEIVAARCSPCSGVSRSAGRWRSQGSAGTRNGRLRMS